MPKNQEKKEIKIQIQLDENVAQGAYVNFAMMSHSETEFLVDFIFIQPQAPKAKVRSRIILSPKHVKRLYQALGENLAKYEERFGKIEVAGPMGPADKMKFVH